MLGFFYCFKLGNKFHTLIEFTSKIAYLQIRAVAELMSNRNKKYGTLKSQK